MIRQKCEHDALVSVAHVKPANSSPRAAAPNDEKCKILSFEFKCAPTDRDHRSR
jgi:hypothetical protein